MSVDPSIKKYWCFISYRQLDNRTTGRQWATWLHQQIETYEVPADLVGTVNDRGETIPSRIFPVFRDEDELSASYDLNSPIFKAINRSLYMLVICSPRAVASPYVAEEIRHFKKLGKSERVLAALIDGEPKASWDPAKLSLGFTPDRECFPESLQHPLDESGALDRSKRIEPIAADFRLPGGMEGWTSPEAYRDSLEKSEALSSRQIDEEIRRYLDQCKLAKLKILAGILGVPLGSLTQRDRAYQLEKAKQRTRVFRRVAISMGALAVFAIGGGVLAYINQRRAEKSKAEAVTSLDKANSLLWKASYSAWNEAERSRAAGTPQESLAYVAKGMENAPGNKNLLTFAHCLIGSELIPWRSLIMEFPVAGVSFDESSGGLIVAERIYDASVRYSWWDLETIKYKDRVDVGADGGIPSEMRKAHPWLDRAPVISPKEDELSGFSPEVLAPGGFQKLVSGQSAGGNLEEREAGISVVGKADDARVVAVSLRGGDYGIVPECILPNAGRYTKAAWSSDGSRLVTVHGTLDTTEMQRGRILIWDFRRSQAINFLPDNVSPFSSNIPDRVKQRRGAFELREMEEGQGIGISGQKDALWKCLDREGVEYSELMIGGSGERVLQVTYPVNSERGPVDIALKWRATIDGNLLSCTKVRVADFRSSSPVVVAVHPSDPSAVMLNDSILLVWKEPGVTPLVMTVPGPEDRMGWANSLTFTPDGKTLLVGTGRKMIALMWPELELIAGPVYHDSLVSDIVVSKNGKLAISGSGFGDGAGSSGYGQLWILPNLEEAGPRFSHEQQMSGFGFAENDSLLYTASESDMGSDLRFWETSTSLPVTTYLKAPALTGQAFISFNSYTSGEVADLRMGGEVDSFGRGTYRMRLPRTSIDTPKWFYEDFLPLVCGKRLGSDGAVKDLRPDALRKHYLNLMSLLISGEESVYMAILRWYFTNPSTRFMDPWNDLSTEVYLESKVFAPYRQGGSHGRLGTAYFLDPSHPLLHMHLALREKSKPLKSRLMSYGLQRLQSQSNLDRYGAAAWKAQLQIGKELLSTLGEKQDAIDKLEQMAGKL